MSAAEMQVALSIATTQNTTALLQAAFPLLSPNGCCSRVISCPELLCGCNCGLSESVYPPFREWLSRRYIPCACNDVLEMGIPASRIDGLIARGEWSSQQTDLLLAVNQLRCKQLQALLLAQQITPEQVQLFLMHQEKGLCARFHSFLPQNEVH